MIHILKGSITLAIILRIICRRSKIEGGPIRRLCINPEDRLQWLRPRVVMVEIGFWQNQKNILKVEPMEFSKSLSAECERKRNQG